MIKLLLYLSIALALFSGYYVGANRGYELGVMDGVNKFLIKGIQLGLVDCHYIKKENKKNECKSNFHPKIASTQYNLFRGRQTSQGKFIIDCPSCRYRELQDPSEMVWGNGY